MPSKRIVGNWKMYKTLPEALKFLEEIAPAADKSPDEVWLSVPFTLISELSKRAASTKIWIGAQNMNDASEGAFTGEISAKMLLDAGAKFVLLGHSERRRTFKESDEFINKKVKRASESKLPFILCVGETLEERERGETKDVITRQVEKGLEGISDLSLATIAYEPVWAIGTGAAASCADAASAHKIIHKLADVKVLYGGSVTDENAPILLKEKEIDGLLIGSASLNSQNFAKIFSLKEG